MKTVQETLRGMDRNELVRQFLMEHPSKLTEFDKDMTIGEAIAREKKIIDNYIERLLTLKTEPNKDKMIFYMYEYFDGSSLNEYRGLCGIDELKEKGAASPNYGIEYSKQEEIMGYFVADTEITQYYLMDLMQEILWDTFFFGTEQEHLAAATKELEEAAKQKTYKSFSSIEEFEKELYGPDDLPPKLNKADQDEEEKLFQKVDSLETKFNDHLQQMEINKILKNIGE